MCVYNSVHFKFYLRKKNFPCYLLCCAYHPSKVFYMVHAHNIKQMHVGGEILDKWIMGLNAKYYHQPHIGICCNILWWLRMLFFFPIN